MLDPMIFEHRFEALVFFPTIRVNGSNRRFKIFLTRTLPIVDDI